MTPPRLDLGLRGHDVSTCGLAFWSGAAGPSTRKDVLVGGFERDGIDGSVGGAGVAADVGDGIMARAG
jgi:hypothetical protein